MKDFSFGLIRRWWLSYSQDLGDISFTGDRRGPTYLCITPVTNLQSYVLDETSRGIKLTR